MTSEAIEVFTKFKSMVEKQSGHKIKTLKSDGDWEYIHQMILMHYIVHEMVPPYTPQQNGSEKRKNMSIMNMVRSILKGKYQPNKLCGEVVSI